MHAQIVWVGHDLRHDMCAWEETHHARNERSLYVVRSIDQLPIRATQRSFSEDLMAACAHATVATAAATDVVAAVATAV